MKVFVTGATGFIGAEILKHLHAAGLSIRILARNPDCEAVQDLLALYPAEVRVGNILDPASMVGAFEGMHAVIHLIGIISEIHENTFESVHTAGTENVIDAAQQAGVGRLVHMSALGARPDAISRYHQSKWLAEQAVRQSDLDYTIFRPSLVFGPGDQFVNLFARIIRFSPIVPILADDHCHFQPVAVENVASAFVRAAMEPKAIGETYDLCGPETLTFSEIVDEICKAMGRKRLKLHVPSFMAVRQAAVLEWVFPRLLRKASPLNRDQLIMLRENNVGNPQPANDLFKLQHKGFQQGIAASLRE